MPMRPMSAVSLSRRALLSPPRASLRTAGRPPSCSWTAVSRPGVPVPLSSTTRGRGHVSVSAASNDRRNVSAAYLDAEKTETKLNGFTTPSSQAEMQVTKLKPGEADDDLFLQHPSVASWRAWYFSDADYTSTPERVAAALQRMVGSIVASSPTDATSVAYWAYHSTRNMFMAAQGVAGVAFTDLQKMIRGDSRATFSPVQMGARLMSEAYECFRQDLGNIHQGVYKLPWDMTTVSHRQYNPLYVLSSSLRFLTEADRTLKRRREGRPDKVWMESAMYPDYYLNTFHYQSDGWMSSASATVYETSTETLFIGRQDAMQRNSLVPLHAWMTEGGRHASEVSLLEVACGTGRFHTFIKDNHPQMQTTALELSPYYLQAARQNVDYWARATGNASAAPTSFVQAAAEDIPSPDGSFDVVMCVYLFHEMPPEARRQAAAEMARVLKPGGLLVLTDSIQLGDRPVLDANIGKFQDFNEPYYRDYVNSNLGQLFAEQGLLPDRKSLSSVTKTLSFRKPAA